MNLETLRHLRPQIEALSSANGIENIRVFGSVARGEAHEGSDVDLLVSVKPGVGWEFFGFWGEMEDLLGCKVDVISDRAINRHIRDQVLKDAIPLWE